MTDMLSITCHVCEKVVREKRVKDGVKLTPKQAVRWHAELIQHITAQHMQAKP
jgi:hypothetical protein